MAARFGRIVAERSWALACCARSFGRMGALVSAFGVAALRADTDVAQAGPNPIAFNQTATTDNVQYLMAGGAEHNSSITVLDEGWPKHMWVNNFGQRNSTDYLKWTVNLPAGAQYHVWALMNTGGPIPFTITDGGSVLNFTTAGIGWNKEDCGVVQLPAGTSTITFVKSDSNAGDWCEIKSLELIRQSDVPSYQARVTSFRQPNSWLATAKYGIMFQYGGWGFPKTGSAASLAQGAVNFNVPKFVSLVKATGASYVVWSITWWHYWMQAPISSVNTIMGNSTLTESSRDLIGDVATALHANGIRFMLYYHQGMQQEPTWAAKQNWPASFELTGTGDRSTFFSNWLSVISEIGNRYGANLDGWFFDDGCVYYPAPFEQLGAAARAGNSSRLISYNPWVSARVTDFQDVYFGEGSYGAAQSGSGTVGGNGIFTSGPHQGLLQHGMFTTENDWGVHAANTLIYCGINASQANSWVQSAGSRHVPLSFALMMWEDGSVSSATLGALAALKYEVSGNPTVFQVANLTDGLVLNGGGAYNGYPVSEWTSVSSTNLQWTLIDQGNGSLKLANRTDGLVLNGGGGFDGYPVTEWTSVASANLQWQLLDQGNGSVKIQNAADGFLLNGGGGYNGYPMTEWQNAASSNLEWTLVIPP